MKKLLKFFKTTDIKRKKGIREKDFDLDKEKRKPKN